MSVRPLPLSLSRLRAGLFVSTIVGLLAFELVWVAPDHATLFAQSFLFAAFCLGLPWLVAELVALGAPRLPRSLVATLLFLVPFYGLLLFQLAHTYFFAEAVERRISLLDLSPSSMRYFFLNVLPRAGAVALVALLVALHGAAYALARRVAAMRRVGFVSLAATGLGSGACLAFGLVPVSPWLDTARDVLELRERELVTYDDHTQLAGSLALLDKSAQREPPRVNYDRVLVFVMETMWPEKFAREAEALPADTFVRSARPHLHDFSRYYTTNQDSRTSVLGLLGSRFIPEQAYTEEGRDRYLFLERESSLVDQFQRLGFETAFAASQGELELVVGDLSWKHELMLEPRDLEAAQKKYLCFNPYEFEHSCEDKALLPEIFALLDKGERLFLVQQMMWGHASEYNVASGKTNTRYYSEYLDLVVQHLKERGLLERTLIVVTGDHGFREKDHQLVPGVYQVPLWFYAPSLTARTSDGLYSHLDFKELLMRELAGDPTLPPENPFVMIVGTTGSSLLAVFDRREMYVIKDRPFASYLLPGGHRALDGRELPRSDAPLLGRYLKLFHTYRAEFGPRAPGAP